MILVLGGHNNDNGSVENDECYMSTLWNRSDWIRDIKFSSSTINGSKHSIVIIEIWLSPYSSGDSGSYYVH